MIFFFFFPEPELIEFSVSVTSEQTASKPVNGSRSGVESGVNETIGYCKGTKRVLFEWNGPFSTERNHDNEIYAFNWCN